MDKRHNSVSPERSPPTNNETAQESEDSTHQPVIASGEVYLDGDPEPNISPAPQVSERISGASDQEIEHQEMAEELAQPTMLSRSNSMHLETIETRQDTKPDQIVSASKMLVPSTSANGMQINTSFVSKSSAKSADKGTNTSVTEKCSVISVVCRICYDETLDEPVISPCNCKGTIGLVHKSCLERWLAESNTDKCDLCHKQFLTERKTKYTVGKSLCVWLKSKGMCLLVLGSLLIVAYLRDVYASSTIDDLRDRWIAAAAFNYMEVNYIGALLLLASVLLLVSLSVISIVYSHNADKGIIDNWSEQRANEFSQRYFMSPWSSVNFLKHL